jgi:hypothetical protein
MPERLVQIRHTHRSCRVVRSQTAENALEHIRTTTQGAYLIPISQVHLATHIYTGFDLPCTCANIVRTEKLEIITIDPVILNLRCARIQITAPAHNPATAAPTARPQ